ncbi:MAG: MazG family protein [Kiritimatiellae bacterium]|nr:MazG family protein [Kiritimatiellia bacterium]
MTAIERLHAIMKRLRDPEKGCPWDRVQTLENLKPCLLEETYELLSAMDNPAEKVSYIEELGDVLLQIMFQSVMAEEKGEFTFDDVANAVSDKLVHRHPHVFGDVKADTPEAVLHNWEHIKKLERAKKARSSALDGVPRDLPALLKARRTMEKASRTGYEEQMQRVEIKGDPGEFLLAAVKAIADAGLDAEAQLEKATSAFASRFKAFEDAHRGD